MSEQKWMPMNDAPKIPCAIIAMCEGGQIFVVTNLYKNRRAPVRGWYSKPGYYTVVPTAWMPLPPSPTKASEG